MYRLTTTTFPIVTLSLSVAIKYGYAPPLKEWKKVAGSPSIAFSALKIASVFKGAEYSILAGVTCTEILDKFVK